MSDTSLVVVDQRQAVVQGIDLPSPPPTRIYISGHIYKITSPRVPLPPILNTVKLILNWASTAGAIAKNIWFLKTAPAYVTSDPSNLQATANDIMTALQSGAAVPGQISSQWSLNSVTAKDCGGTTAQATSTSPAVPGSNVAAALPPNAAVVLSWQVATSYRGGKPRTYLPGIPTNAILAGGSSALTTTYATSMANQANALLAYINTQPDHHGGFYTLGTVSYHTAHTVRPTPLFYAFMHCRVHERLDSQRRRLGKESSFPTTP